MVEKLLADLIATVLSSLFFIPPSLLILAVATMAGKLNPPDWTIYLWGIFVVVVLLGWGLWGLLFHFDRALKFSRRLARIILFRQ